MRNEWVEGRSPGKVEAASPVELHLAVLEDFRSSILIQKWQDVVICWTTHAAIGLLHQQQYFLLCPN